MLATPDSQKVLELCREKLPGLQWEISQDSGNLNLRYQAYTGRFVGSVFAVELNVQFNGAIASFWVPGMVLGRSKNWADRTPEEALDDVKEQVLKICLALNAGIGVNALE